MKYVTVRRPTQLGVINEFDRLFESVFGNMTSAPGWSDRRPVVDIRELEDRYLIEAELPGVAESEIDVRVENELLVISAKHNQDEANAGNGYLLHERGAGSFYRSFALPSDADAQRIEARFKNGVLTLDLLKREESKPRQIRIKSE